MEADKHTKMDSYHFYGHGHAYPEHQVGMCVHQVGTLSRCKVNPLRDGTSVLQKDCAHTYTPNLWTKAIFTVMNEVHLIMHYCRKVCKLQFVILCIMSEVLCSYIANYI